MNFIPYAKLMAIQIAIRKCEDKFEAIKMLENEVEKVPSLCAKIEIYKETINSIKSTLQVSETVVLKREELS